MSNHAACFHILTAGGGKEKKIFVIPLENLVKVSCSLTAPFGKILKYAGGDIF